MTTPTPSQPPPPILALGPPSSRYRIYDPGGGGKVARILRSGLPYEHLVLEDMRSLNPTGTAIDVGANMGNHSLYLAVVCQLTVEAFEPIKHEQLQANIALNGLQSWNGLRPPVNVYPIALGREPGSARLIGKNQLEPTNTGANTGAFTVASLDEFNFTNVSILKIDTEGMEEDVIYGGLRTIQENKPTIYAEAWDDDYLDKTRALLAPLGYELGERFRWNQNRWDPK